MLSLLFQLVTEKILRCDNKQDFLMNYEFCREKVSMLEILLYSSKHPSSVLPKITVHSRGKSFNLHIPKLPKTKTVYLPNVNGSL